MHTAPWPKCHAWYTIGGEMHGVRAGSPDDRRRLRSSHVLLRRAKRLNYRQVLVQQHRWIGDIQVQTRFGNAFSLPEIPQDRAKLPLHILNGLAGDRADVDIET